MISELFLTSAKSLFNNKTRTILTMLGIILISKQDLEKLKKPI